MYHKRQVAFVPFAGTDDLSRSHFETQDSIELGQPRDGTRNSRSGFLARLARRLNGPSNAPIAFTDALPLAFRAAATFRTYRCKQCRQAGLRERQAAILSGMYRTSSAAGGGRGLELRQEVAQEFGEEMQRPIAAQSIPRGFATEAEHIAKLMRDQYRIGFIDVGGWDTHVNEGGAQGKLANNLDNLGSGLAAFARRSARSGTTPWSSWFRNSAALSARTATGTDHGHGSVYWVLGGSINGGRIAGEQQRLNHGRCFKIAIIRC